MEPMEHYALTLKALTKDCGYQSSLLEMQFCHRFAIDRNHQQLEFDLKQDGPTLKRKLKLVN